MITEEMIIAAICEAFDGYFDWDDFHTADNAVIDGTLNILKLVDMLKPVVKS